MCPSPAAGRRRACRKTRFERGLAQLQAAEFLYDSSLFPEREYTFSTRSPTRWPTGGSFRSGVGRSRASSIVTLERLGGTARTEQDAQLGVMPFQQRPGTRRRPTSDAGGKAAERLACAEAVTRFEQALKALDTFPESREQLAEAI